MDLWQQHRHNSRHDDEIFSCPSLESHIYDILATQRSKTAGRPSQIWWFGVLTLMMSQQPHSELTKYNMTLSPLERLADAARIESAFTHTSPPHTHTHTFWILIYVSKSHIYSFRLRDYLQSEWVFSLFGGEIKKNTFHKQAMIIGLHSKANSRRFSNETKHIFIYTKIPSK